MYKQTLTIPYLTPLLSLLPIAISTIRCVGSGLSYVRALGRENALRTCGRSGQDTTRLVGLCCVLKTVSNAHTHTIISDVISYHFITAHIIHPLTHHLTHPPVNPSSDPPSNPPPL